MADTSNSGKIGVKGLDPSLTQLPEEKAKKKNQVGKDEFLQLLVTQLKYQDPLDPVKNEDFAVNLAQFSQLEALLDIKNALNGNDANSLSAYLGNDVVLNSQTVSVQGGDGGSVLVDIPTAANNVKVDLLDAQGKVVESKNIGALQAGEQLLDLSELRTQKGEYGFRVTGNGATSGLPFETKGFVAGKVSGFIPGDTPLLIMNGREIDPSEIKEVRASST